MWTYLSCWALLYLLGNSTPVEEFSVSAAKDDCESRCCGLSGGLGAFSWRAYRICCRPLVACEKTVKEEAVVCWCCHWSHSSHGWLSMETQLYPRYVIVGTGERHAGSTLGERFLFSTCMLCFLCMVHFWGTSPVSLGGSCFISTL